MEKITLESNASFADLSQTLLRFFSETSASESRLLALLQRINLRALLLASPTDFDLSTDWSLRLLHANLILGCLTRFQKDHVLMANVYPLKKVFEGFTNPTTKGGVKLKLQPDQPVAAFTYSTVSMMSARLTGDYKDASNRILSCALQATENCKKISHFDMDFVEVFCNAARTEIRTLSKMTPSENFTNPLFFPMGDVTIPTTSLYSSDSTILPAEFPARNFWSDWYRGILDGKPLNWDLQLEVAKIPSTDWKKGRDHVGNKIEVIYNYWELSTEIKNLKEQLNQDVKNIQPAVNRLHNNPPDPISDVMSRVPEIVRQVEDLENEISKAKPNLDVIKKIGRWLWDTSKAITQYWKDLGDVALRSAADWAGPALVGYLVTADGIRHISKLASEFAKLIGN